jgi:hypothetical protein
MFLSPLLFLAPEVHLRDLENLWTDEVIIEKAWKRFMSKLLDEWGELILWVCDCTPTKLDFSGFILLTS